MTMARSHSVYWRHHRPTQQDIRSVLEGFFGQALLMGKWSSEHSKFEVTLEGKFSHPMRFVTIGGRNDIVTPEEEALMLAGSAPRTFDIYLDPAPENRYIRFDLPDAVDLYTDSCIRGLTTVFVYAWGAEAG